MRKSILLSATLLVFLASNLVAQTTPAKEFTVKLSESNISLKAGESQTVDVTINRSKAYKKAQIILFIDNKLPEGLTITFADGANPLTDRIMTITTAQDLSNFSNTIILKAKGNRVTKGIMLTLSSATEESLTSK